MPSLYLLRHAEAASKAEAGVKRDAERPLTTRGRAAMESGAIGIARLGLGFDRILTSPYLRARQTAEIVASALGAAVRVEEETALASGASWEAVRAALIPHDAASSILLVGHMPDLTKLAAGILDGGPARIDFGNGTLACFDVAAIPPRGAGTLRFLLSLEQLAATAP